MTHHQDLLYRLALPEVPQIGTVQARILMEHFENAEAVFKAKKSFLEKIEGIGEMRAAAIKSFHQFDKPTNHQQCHRFHLEYRSIAPSHQQA